MGHRSHCTIVPCRLPFVVEEDTAGGVYSGLAISPQCSHGTCCLMHSPYFVAQLNSLLAPIDVFCPFTLQRGKGVSHVVLPQGTVIPPAFLEKR